MQRRPPDFKDTQVFGWETEPKDERPSEFVPSTGFSSLSGYYAMPPDARQLRRSRRRGGGLNVVLVAAGLMVGLGTAMLFGFLYLLKH